MRADEQVPYGAGDSSTMAAIKAAGIENVGMVTEMPQAGADAAAGGALGGSAALMADDRSVASGLRRGDHPVRGWAMRFSSPWSSSSLPPIFTIPIRPRRPLHGEDRRQYSSRRSRYASAALTQDQLAARASHASRPSRTSSNTSRRRRRTRPTTIRPYRAQHGLYPDPDAPTDAATDAGAHRRAHARAHRRADAGGHAETDSRPRPTHKPTPRRRPAPHHRRPLPTPTPAPKTRRSLAAQAE